MVTLEITNSASSQAFQWNIIQCTLKMVDKKSLEGSSPYLYPMTHLKRTYIEKYTVMCDVMYQCEQCSAYMKYIHVCYNTSFTRGRCLLYTPKVMACVTYYCIVKSWIIEAIQYYQY